MAAVDIVVPCYRYGAFLADCIASIQAQTHPDWRVLVIDDASPDDTTEIAQALAARDPRINLLTHRVNRGHIATYNEGIEWAQSPYFLLISADDLLMPHALARAVEIMEERPDVVLTCGATIDFENGDPRASADRSRHHWRIRKGPEFVRQACEAAAVDVSGTTAIVRTAAQKKVGGYRAHLPHTADLEMWLRLATLGSIAQTPAVQACRRVHGANMSLTAQGGALNDYVQREEAFASFFQNEGASLANAGSLEALARRRLGEQAFWTGVAQRVRGHDGTAKYLFSHARRLCPSSSVFPPIAPLLRISRPGHRIANAVTYRLKTAIRKTLA